MRQLMPILKSPEYRKDVPLFFKERLFDSSSSPVIAFGADEGHMIVYESASNEEDYQDRLQLLKQQALDNLKAIRPQIEVQNAQGTKIAFVSDNEYASEKILDVEFMKSVGKSLGSISLMVGIPFKGLLIAIDSNSDIRFKFGAIIQKYYENPEQDPISDKVFLVINGKVAAIAGEHIEDDGASDNFIITEYGNNNNYKVELKSKSIEELTKDANISFQQIMAMIMQRKEFGGEVAYHIGMGLKLDKILTDKCESIVTQIDENEIAQTLVQAFTNSKIKLSFYYQNKKIAPAETNPESSSSNPTYSNLTEGELNNEFYRIVSIPNARTNVTALTEMSALMKEYQKRGLQLPDPNSRQTDKTKKWWQFWK